MINKKIIYITGCLGFIGSYVTKLMLKEGHYVYGIDKITYAANKNLLIEYQKYDNFCFKQIDINDLKWLYDCDYIINLAAETHVDNSIVNSDEFIMSNINGVQNLLELIRTKRQYYKMPIFLHFSTDEVYGDTLFGSHIETDPLKPSNPYSATKAAADLLIFAWNRTYNIPYIIVRPTNNYGIGQYVEKLIPKTCKYMKINRKINLHKKGDPNRIWLHAEDTAKAIKTIIEKGKINEIYNISGKDEQKNIDIVKQILNLYYKKDIINIKNYIDFEYERLGADLRYSINDSKLRSLGWKPTSNLNNELRKIVKYYKNNFIW